MKRITLLFSVVACLSMLRLNAVNAPTATLSNVTSYGSTAIVTVKVTNFIDISACNLQLTFDPTIAYSSISGVTVGAGLPAGVLNVNVNGNRT